MKIAAYAIVLVVLSGGCFQQIAINSLGEIMDKGFTVLNEEQDLELAEQTIPSNLKLLETILKTDPNNDHYLFLASMGYSSYALGFVEDQNPERAKLFYLRGKNYGLHVLTRHRAIADALNKTADELKPALATLSKDDVPAVFWTAVGWGSLISFSLTDPSAVADLPKVTALMEFVLERDSTYFYGGAHFFLGTLEGTRPKMFGGNPESSREHFERCLNINHRQFLMTYIYYARSYAVQTQNQELFEHCLAIVDSTSLDVLPAARLSNAIAKRKAQFLRTKLHDLF